MGVGPLAGLQAGLRAMNTPWLLAVACDMPFITQDVLRALVQARTPETVAIVARTPDGRWHPLCACYHQQTVSIVEEQLNQGIYALHAMLERLDRVAFVDLPSDPLRNINHPTDLSNRKGWIP